MNFEASVYLDKSRIRVVYIIGGIAFILAIAAIIWSVLYGDEFTEIRRNALTGSVRERGLGPAAKKWGIGFAIFIPLVYGIMAATLDFKNPAYAVNREGFYINKDMFRKTFIAWSEVASIERISDSELHIRLKDMESVIARQRGFTKPFLKTTYVTQNQPIVVSGKMIKGDIKKVTGLILQYS